jgi:hypothetical protein
MFTIRISLNISMTTITLKIEHMRELEIMATMFGVSRSEMVDQLIEQQFQELMPPTDEEFLLEENNT